MLLFHKIPDAEAIIRVANGVYKQAEVYHRGERVFIGAAGGFVRVVAKFGDEWGTSHPKIKVLDISQDVPGLFVTKEPRYKAG